MTIKQSARLDEGNCRQFTIGDVGIKISRILQVLGNKGRVRHDLGFIQEGIADVAIDALRRVRHETVPTFSVVLPRYIFGEERVAYGFQRGRRNGERAGVDAAIAVVAWVVVVEQIIRTKGTVRLRVSRQRIQVTDDCTDSGLGWVGTFTV